MLGVLGLLTVLGRNLFANLDGEGVVVVVLVLEGLVVCSNLDDARERDRLLLEV